MGNIIAWCHEHELATAFLLYLFTYVFTALFNPKTREERDQFRKDYPIWGKIVWFTSGIGIDAVQVNQLLDAVKRAVTKRGS